MLNRVNLGLELVISTTLFFLLLGSAKASQSFIEAAKNGQLARVRQLLSVNETANSSSSSVISVDVLNKSLLALAANCHIITSIRELRYSTDVVEIVKLLKQNGATLLARDDLGRTPLMNAAQHCVYSDIFCPHKKFGDPCPWESTMASFITSLLIANDTSTLDAKDDNNMTAISMAKDPAVVKILLTAGASVNVEGKYGSPLMAATSGANVEVARMLLASGAQTEQLRDEDGMTAFLLAVTLDKTPYQAKILNLLLQYNASFLVENNKGETPLILAACKSGLHLVEPLLHLGASIHGRSKETGKTAFSCAIEHGLIKEVKIMLLRNVSIVNDTTDFEGLNPLMLALNVSHRQAANMEPELVSLLSDLTAPKNFKHFQQILLYFAIEQGDAQKMGELFSATNDLDIDWLYPYPRRQDCKVTGVKCVDLNNATALIAFAAHCGNPRDFYSSENQTMETIQLLKQNGADFEVRNSQGMNAVMVAASKCSYPYRCQTSPLGADCNPGSSLNSANFVKAFISEKTDLNARDVFDKSAMDYAIGDASVVKVLIEAGASVDARSSKSNMTILHTLLSMQLNGDFDQMMTNLLLDYGADIEARDGEGNTPLMLAAENGKRKLFALLLKRNASALVANNRGQTVLMKAVLSENLLIFNLAIYPSSSLIDHQDEYGKTALMYAVEKEQFGMFDRLLEKRANPNLQSKNGITALQLAANNSNACYLKSLMRLGFVTKNARDINGNDVTYLSCQRD